MTVEHALRCCSAICRASRSRGARLMHRERESCGRVESQHGNVGATLAQSDGTACIQANAPSQPLTPTSSAAHTSSPYPRLAHNRPLCAHKSHHTTPPNAPQRLPREDSLIAHALLPLASLPHAVYSPPLLPQHTHTHIYTSRHACVCVPVPPYAPPPLFPPHVHPIYSIEVDPPQPTTRPHDFNIPPAPLSFIASYFVNCFTPTPSPSPHYHNCTLHGVAAHCVHSVRHPTPSLSRAPFLQCLCL